MATIFKSGGHAHFDKLLDKATSNLLLEPEWASIIQICDLIRQKDCQPKYAVGQIKRKLHHSNPHVSYFALQVLESVVKNCGSPVHEEISSKQFMEELKDLAKTTHHENIRDKILELIQTWAHAFRKIPSYRAVQDVLNIMKTEGAKFPPLVDSDAMFLADQAPEWADGECCHRCRVEFSFTQRKHHCRACGQIFCSKCSSKECTLPKFGIEKEVRVCDSCFEKYGREGGSSAASSASGNSSSLDEHVHAANSHTRASNNGVGVTVNKQSSTAGAAGDNKPSQKELELAEEEQLQLALAISQSEAEAKEQELKNRNKRMYTSTKQESTRAASPPPPPQSQTSSSQDDPELSRYLNRSYWENKSNATASQSPQAPQEKQQVSSSFMPSAPLKLSSNSAFQQPLPEPATTAIIPTKPPTEEDQTVDMFLDTLRTQIEMFVNRMNSNSSRGRPIANDTSVQSLFMSITHMHSQLLTYIQVQDNARARYELLQDKLNQVRDARAALDDLRNEHAEELRRQQEEQERIRAYQMAQKLALMRQKKNEYLQYQRQLAMQRMQEQEREMQMRIAQQGMPPQQPGGHIPPWGMHPGYPPMGHPPAQPMYPPAAAQPPPPQQQQWINNQNLPGVIPGTNPQPPAPQMPVLNSPTNSNTQLPNIPQQQQPPGGMMYGQTGSDPNIPSSQPQQVQIPQQQPQPPQDPNGIMIQQQQHHQVNSSAPQTLPPQQLPPQQAPPPQQMSQQQQQPPPQQMPQQQQQPPPQQMPLPPPQQQQPPQSVPQHPQQLPPEQQQQLGPAPGLPDQQQLASPPPQQPTQIAELISFD